MKTNHLTKKNNLKQTVTIPVILPLLMINK